MRNLRLEIEYDGTDYCGWQIQTRDKHKPSIQETLEKTLRKILRQKIKLIGSGRTDSGVHALGQVANFKTDTDISLEKLQKSLNALLPGNIVVTKIAQADADFHSRFLAKSKVYRYTVLNRPYRSSFLRGRVYFCKHPLDLKLMQKEAKILLGRHDFRSFQATDKKEKNSWRTIKKIRISKDCDLIHFEIEANGFLQQMVRNIAGTLIEIGRGKFPKGSLKGILLARDRRLAGPTAPACGLCLIKVKY